nr:MAG TPA: hypothetical protein [Caudoviricetes sp.]
MILQSRTNSGAISLYTLILSYLSQKVNIT